MKLQGSAASKPETWQSKPHGTTENRLAVNRLAVVHGRFNNQSYGELATGGHAWVEIALSGRGLLGIVGSGNQLCR
jgi:hypothetical protein